MLTADPVPHAPRWKIPASVLVVIYTPQWDVLLLRRTGGDGQGGVFWQSVTGSKDAEDESWWDTAVREVREECGIEVGQLGCVLRDWALENVYPIYPQWRHRYAPHVTHNRERVLGLAVPSDIQVQLNPREHTAFAWHPWREAALRCYAPSNAEAILWLPRFACHE